MAGQEDQHHGTTYLARSRPYPHFIKFHVFPTHFLSNLRSHHSDPYTSVPASGTKSPKVPTYALDYDHFSHYDAAQKSSKPWASRIKDGGLLS